MKQWVQRFTSSEMAIDNISQDLERLGVKEYTSFWNIPSYQIIVELDYQGQSVAKHNHVEIYCTKHSFRLDTDGKEKYS